MHKERRLKKMLSCRVAVSLLLYKGQISPKICNCFVRSSQKALNFNLLCLWFLCLSVFLSFLLVLLLPFVRLADDLVCDFLTPKLNETLFIPPFKQNRKPGVEKASKTIHTWHTVSCWRRTNHLCSMQWLTLLCCSHLLDVSRAKVGLLWRTFV